MSKATYQQIIDLVQDCVRRMQDAGESHRMLARWISEGINAALENVPAGDDGQCPRPCNGRPDGFSMRDCIEAGECGCIAFPAAQVPLPEIEGGDKGDAHAPEGSIDA